MSKELDILDFKSGQTTEEIVTTYILKNIYPNSKIEIRDSEEDRKNGILHVRVWYKPPESISFNFKITEGGVKFEENI